MFQPREGVEEQVYCAESMVEHLIFFLAKEEVARFNPYAKTFDNCKVNLLQVLSCKVLESIVVAADIREDNTITPDGGKLIVTLIPHARYSTLTLATCLLSQASCTKNRQRCCKRSYSLTSPKTTLEISPSFHAFSSITCNILDVYRPTLHPHPIVRLSSTYHTNIASHYSSRCLENRSYTDLAYGCALLRPG